MPWHNMSPASEMMSEMDSTEREESVADASGDATAANETGSETPAPAFTDAQHLDLRVVGLETDQFRQLAHAGAAPRCPEVDQQRLPSQVT